MDRPTAVSPPTGLSLARALLVVNGAIDALSGVLMFVAAEPIVWFLGIGNPLIVEAVGVVLALFGAGVFWLGLRALAPAGPGSRGDQRHVGRRYRHRPARGHTHFERGWSLGRGDRRGYRRALRCGAALRPREDGLIASPARRNVERGCATSMVGEGMSGSEVGGGA